MTRAWRWWQTGTIYQIYPRSFQDGNGDGIGDLAGIRQRLDYLQSLPIDALWLSPIYPSPMHDFGYDIADYTGIHPLFGAMSDFDRLLAETHARGLKLILDLVPNHTSDEHPWFKESRSGREHARRDWYIWADPAADGGPPNNWLSFFGGPAWTYDAHTGQYYLHQFTARQPELNYRHPGVLPAMLDVMRFWLAKGVDGFRIDVIALLMKDAQWRDEPDDPTWDGMLPHGRLQHVHTQNVPGIHPIVRAMRAVLDEFDERVMIGEIYAPNDVLAAYYGRLGPSGGRDECHLPFNFQLISTPWTALDVRRAVDRYEAALPALAWPNWVLGNHDQARIATRVGPGQARVAAMLLLTLRGTPTLYYGDEIGMRNVPIPPAMRHDPPALQQPELADAIGRDPVRTPMQWNASGNAGFADAGVPTWLPVADDFATCNVERQDNDPGSMLSLVRALLQCRRREGALQYGDYAAVEAGVDDVFAYRRTAEREILVVLNFSDAPRAIDLGQVAETAALLVATQPGRQGTIRLASLTLAADEGLVLALPE